MTGGSLFVVVFGSLFFPGLGQGIAHRRIPMLALAFGTLATTFAILWSVWFLPATFLVRFVGAADAYRSLRRHAPPSNRMLAATAVVIGAIGLGYAQLALEAFKIPSSSMNPTLAIGDHIYVDKLSPRWRPIERGEVVVFEQPCARHAYIKRVIATAGDTVEVRCSVVYVNGKAVPSTLVAPSASYPDYDEHEGTWLSRTSSRYRETLGTYRYDVFHDVERPANDKSGGAPARHDFPQLDRLVAPSCHHGDFYEPKPGVQQATGTIVHASPGAAPCDPQAHFVVPPSSLFVMGDNRNNANDSRYWGVVSTDAVVGRVVGVWLSAPPGRDRDWTRFGALD